MKEKELKQLFASFNDKTVLVIGDVMIDAYLWGNVDRISPEAPVPVISRTERENRLGGAANVALNIQALGATPILCAVIGNDEKSKIFFNLLEKRKLSKEGILTSNERITTTKTRIISNNQHLLRVDEEVDKPLAKEIEAKFADHLCNLIEKNAIDAIVFEDYDKGSITPLIIEKVTEIAQKKNIPTLVDPKKRNFLDYKNITLFKPNFKELVEGLKLNLEKGDFDGLHKASHQFQKESNLKMVLVTLSELGVFINYNGSFYSVPAEIRDITDVSGAGDTVISTASLCLAMGLEPEKIAAISNLAGGLVCEKVGVVPINKQQLLEEVIEYFDN